MSTDRPHRWDIGEVLDRTDLAALLAGDGLAAELAAVVAAATRLNLCADYTGLATTNGPSP